MLFIDNFQKPVILLRAFINSFNFHQDPRKQALVWSLCYPRGKQGLEGLRSFWKITQLGSGKARGLVSFSLMPCALNLRFFFLYYTLPVLRYFCTCLTRSWTDWGQGLCTYIFYVFQVFSRALAHSQLRERKGGRNSIFFVSHFGEEISLTF